MSLKINWDNQRRAKRRENTFGIKELAEKADVKEQELRVFVCVLLPHYISPFLSLWIALVFVGCSEEDPHTRKQALK